MNKRLLGSCILLILVLASAVLPISFTASPAISPISDKRPDTNDDLTCTWAASGDMTTQNVTWYRDGVAFTTESPPSSLSTLSASGTSRGEMWNCTVTLGNGTDNVEESVNVTIKNAYPTVPSMVNITNHTIGNTTMVIEDYVNEFYLNSTDPDGDEVTFGYLGSLPGGSDFDSEFGIFAWTPAYTSQGLNITFYATDSYGANPAITTKRVYFGVQYINDAPLFSPGLNPKSINEAQTLTYLITATDEEANHPLSFSVISIPNLDLELTPSGNTQTILTLESNRTAYYSEAGNYTVSITVTDSLGANTTSQFMLQINQTNLPPTLSFIPNMSGTQGLPFSLSVNASDPDTNDTLNFTIMPLSCTTPGVWSITTTDNSSNGSASINIPALTNDHVVCRLVRIMVIDDDGAEDSQDVFFNISNTNDPPIVRALSSFSNNSDGQQNMSRLIAYADAPFIYKVNATDVDELTYQGEILSYSDDSALFDISNSTGIVSFTPQESDIGNYTITITVTDDQGLSAPGTMELEIRNNSAPILTPIGDITCYEDSPCVVTVNATDADLNNLTISSNDTTNFPLTSNYSANPIRGAGFTYTPNQSRVGNYSITVTVTDIRGASDQEALTLQIANTNDKPNITAFSFLRVVEGHAMSLVVNAQDEDYYLPSSAEYVTFNVMNTSGKLLFNTTTVFNPLTNRTEGRIYFIPTTGDAGNYTVNISATDASGSYDSVSKTFEILPRSNPPVILQVMPYGKPLFNSTYFTLGNASGYVGYTAVNFTENRTIIYNTTFSDDFTPEGAMGYQWYLNGTLISTSRQLSLVYGYFSEGQQNLVLVLSDDMYENTTFSWNITVEDINRPPTLVNYLENIVVNRTMTFANYFKNAPTTHFLDPDDDLNSNQQWDPNETSHLTYTFNNCSVAEIEIEDQSLRVKPAQIGSCTVFFTGLDYAGLSQTSNGVVINVTYVPDEVEEVEVPSGGGGGGGGGGGSRAVLMPTKKEELKPQAIEIIVPEIMTTYDNETAVIPVTVQNVWNGSLRGIKLNATTAGEGVKLSFSKDYIEELGIGKKTNVSLYVMNFRLGEDYKINISANVSEPKTSDTAYVFLNSIEKSKSGESVNTKVTFAQDLLRQNPECLELNELLVKAKQRLSAGADAEASELLDSVIDGCKYLVSMSRKTEQKPEQTLANKLLSPQYSKYLIGFAIFSFFLVILIALVQYRKNSKEKI